MEGVGARLGRSSTRYGPATVFTGPVRKWKKKWVHVAPSSSSSSTSTTTTATSNSNNNGHHSHNGPSNGNNGSHLALYKWTPITPSQNDNNNNNADKKQDNQHLSLPPDEPPRRKFKYIPVAVLEEQKESENEVNENIEDDVKPYGSADQSADGQIPKVVISNEKPDINDVPMEESQGKNQVVRQDLNESTLDLSLGLTSHEDDQKSNSKSNQNKDGK